MTFDPVKINLQQTQNQCEHGGRKSACVTTEVCFVYSVKSDNQDVNAAAGESFSILIHSFLCRLTVKDVVFHYYVFSLLSCSAEIRYHLTLDALRAKARASFIDTDDKSDRKITRTFTIKDRERKCVRETFMMSASTLILMMSTWGYLQFLTCTKSTPKLCF